jgi:RNA polymerase sigma factor (sigma-70 family)
MLEPGDNDLLTRYVREGSDEAFSLLVSRHVNLVYSVALRHVADAHQAEDITQVVFLLLAKKAGSLSPKTILPGWLYRTAQLTAANFVRMETRRQRREQEVCMQSFSSEPEPEAWAQVAPALDAAMARLGAKEREAVVLRFFENRSLKEAGGILGASEAAVQKRVERALKKLRLFFTKRGIAVSATALTCVLSANTVQAAPAGLAESVMTAVATKGAVASGSSALLMKSTLKLITWLKVKTAVVAGVSAILIAGAGTVTISRIHARQSAVAEIGMLEPDQQPSQLEKRYSADAVAAMQNDKADIIMVDLGESGAQDARDHMRRGRRFLAKGAYDMAIAEFNQAIQLNPKVAPAYFNRGRACKLRGYYQQALADYTQAIQLNPAMVAAYVNRGQIYNVMEEYDRAIADCSEAIRLDAARPIPYNNRGAAHGAKGEYDKARADFALAIQCDPDFAPAYNNLAWQLATCPEPAYRNGNSAVEFATKACELSQWNNINQLDTLAAAYAEAGDFENAVNYESKVLASPGLAPRDVAIAKKRLALYRTHQPFHRKPFSKTNP